MNTKSTEMVCGGRCTSPSNRLTALLLLLLACLALPGRAQSVAPTVTITEPSTGSSFTAPGCITLRADAFSFDGFIDHVSFSETPTVTSFDPNNSCSTANNYSYQWNNVPPGSYTVTATAVDKAGHSTTSSPITITVNGILVSLIEPTAGANFSTSNMSVAVQAALTVPTTLVDHVTFYATPLNGTPIPIRSLAS